MPINHVIVKQTAILTPRELRSLDAIHLASALSLNEDPADFLAYDVRLFSAAAKTVLPVVSRSRGPQDDSPQQHSMRPFPMFNHAFKSNTVAHYETRLALPIRLTADKPTISPLTGRCRSIARRYCWSHRNLATES